MSSETFEFPSCSTSLAESVFESVVIPDPTNHKTADASESSLSIIDLDDLGSLENLISVDKNASLVTPGWLMEDCHKDRTKICDVKLSSVSSVKQDSGNLGPSSSSFASPGTLANVAQSTPVREKTVDSDIDPGGAGDSLLMNAPCSSDRPNSTGQSELSNEKSKKMREIGETTYTCDNRLKNDTYTARPGTPESNSSSTQLSECMPVPAAPILAREELNDQAQEKTHKRGSYSARSSISEISKDGCIASTKSRSKEETKKKNERKPLSALNKATQAREKPHVSSQSNKRSNRLPAPRMNAAALSRIQARSPQKHSSAVHDENTSSSLKPSSGIARRPLVKFQVAAVKRPLPIRTNTASSAKLAAPKRKIDGPKDHGRSTKVDVTSKFTATSRLGISVAASKTSSSLRKPQVSTLSHHRAATAAADSSSRTALPKRTTRTKAKDGVKSRSNINVKSKEFTTSQCAVAMATLLDYVVNQLGGLAAPQLSSDNEQLQHLLSQQKTSNDKLSSRIDDLEKCLNDSRASHERDVIRYEKEVTQLKADNESTKTDFSRQLEKLNEQILKQAADHRNVVESMKEEQSKAIGDATAQHDEEVAQLRHEWSEERAEMERDTHELRESFNKRVEAKVEELIKPYINSYEENKSLRAVLEMKNSEQHRLNVELSQLKEQFEEIHNLRDHLTRLEQRNEDLQMQVEEKSSEQRELRNSIAELNHELVEKQRVNRSLQQLVDQLEYRLSTSTPSPASPFNPVFTPSPSVSQFGSSNDHSPGFRTPVRTRHPKMGVEDLESADILRENGMT